MKNRTIVSFLMNRMKKPENRIIVLTGGRQTGKTTLARTLFPDYQFLSIEDPILRGTYARLTAAQWRELYPKAILDEVQKEPSLIESIKSVYDQWTEPRYIFTGSSQLLLLEKVRESLAGRCIIVELYPLTVPELETENWAEPVVPSPFQKLLSAPDNTQEYIKSLLPDFALDPAYAKKLRAWDFYTRLGGYPALVNPELDDEDRYLWLLQYVRTYLERDVRDLAALRDLEPFVRLQRYVAFQTGAILNYSGLAQQIGISTKTVQRYIRYLEMSYQTLILPAWERNKSKQLVKAPKLHFLDYGVLQAITQKRGAPNGQEFESLVIAELFKQERCIFVDAHFFYLRTFDGKEIDLLIELPEGYFAFEIKMAERALATDTRHLRGLQEMLDKPLLHSFVLSNDPQTKSLGEHITAVHAAYFLT